MSERSRVLNAVADAIEENLEMLAIAESWRPFRTWATVLIRLAGDRGTKAPRPG